METAPKPLAPADPRRMPTGSLEALAAGVLEAAAQQQEEALLALVALPDARLAGLLEQLWSRGGNDGRELCALVLGRRGAAGLSRFTGPLLRDDLGCRWLVDVLADVPDEEATRLLLVLLDHPAQGLRRRAADGLASHRSWLDHRGFVRELATPLAKGLEWPPPLQAVRCLHRIADPALEPDFGRDAARRAERVLVNCVRHEQRPAPRGDAIAALGEIGSRNAVRCLVDMLSRSDEHFHRDVVVALRKIRPERAMVALLGLLRSRDPIIREEAANALGEIGDPQAARRLRELLEDPNDDVRQEAVLALGKLGGRDVLVALESALRDPSAPVRVMACNALAEAMGRQATGKLLHALYDMDAGVRAEAAYHLGNVGDDSARPHLELWSDDIERDEFGDSVGSVVRKALWRLQLGLREAG